MCNGRTCWKCIGIFVSLLTVHACSNCSGVIPISSIKHPSSKSTKFLYSWYIFRYSSQSSVLASKTTIYIRLYKIFIYVITNKCALYCTAHGEKFSNSTKTSTSIAKKLYEHILKGINTRMYVWCFRYKPRYKISLYSFLLHQERLQRTNYYRKFGLAR